jgi:hypothetical protein
MLEKDKEQSRSNNRTLSRTSQGTVLRLSTEDRLTLQVVRKK